MTPTNISRNPWKECEYVDYKQTSRRLNVYSAAEKGDLVLQSQKMKEFKEFNYFGVIFDTILS